MDGCRLLCCLLGQCGRVVRFQLKIGTTSPAESEGVIGSYKASHEPCDFSNNFGAQHLLRLGSQPRPTGYETTTERLPVPNSHVCASLLTSELTPPKKNARRSRAWAAANKSLCCPRMSFCARGALIRRRGDNRRHADTRQSTRRARERKHASARGGRNPAPAQVSRVRTLG